MLSFVDVAQALTGVDQQFPESGLIKFANRYTSR
jgi:hypothetical protein